MDLAREIKYAMQTDARQRGVLSEIRHSIVHEGDRFTVHREDGSSETRPYHAIEASIELSPDDIQSEDAKKVAEAVEDLTEQLAEQGNRKLFETVGRAVEEVGTVLNAGGRPFTAELWLDLLQKVEIDFEEDGAWRPPTLVLHPTMLSRAQSQLERLENEPALKQRLESIVNNKRTEWRAREANRKLVD